MAVEALRTWTIRATFLVCLFGSVTLQGQTLSPPEAVILIDATCTSLTVGWEELHTGNHTHLVGYTVRFRAVNDNASPWQYRNEIYDTTFILGSLNESTQYEIQVGVAYNQVGGDKDLSVGSGENLMSVLYSESLLATTLPAEMGRVPSPPTDVQFTAASAGLITASWTVNDCRDNPNCVMTHGYVATCCMPGSEISTTVWQSDMESVDPIRVEITGVNPATRYVCKVAAFNAYGVGNTGSNIFVSTPEAVPSTAPTQVYCSDIQTNSIRLNWHYEETPSPGEVNTFKIEIFYKDNRYPSRNGEHVQDIIYNVANVGQSLVVFSYLLMYLDPGTEYNVLIRAVTVAGEGPAARVGQQTLSTVPTIVPHDLTGVILSYVPEPPSFFFQWVVRNADRHLFNGITAFLITCSANKITTAPNTFNDIVAVSKPVFIEDDDASFQTDFSTSLYFPNTCGSHVSEEISCSVAAFNKQGRGEESNNVTFTLPCDSVPKGALEGSFLTDPHSSLGLLSALILLVLGVMVGIAMLCVCNTCWPRGLRLHKKMSSSSIDENYVPMASSEAAVKTRWSDRCTSDVGVASNEMGDPPYDEIPVDQVDNLYDEIHPRSCRDESTVTEDTHTSGGTPQNGLHSSGQQSYSVTHLKTDHIITRQTASQSGLQTIPIPLSSRSQARDSTVTQYMEISSPLLGDGGDATTTTMMRYSVADSGVNMTSSDVERGLNLDQSLHSEPPLTNGLENIQFRQYPYHTTEITLSDAHPESLPDPTEDSFYTTMLPYSALAGNHDILEQNGDTRISVGDASESGVGTSELSNRNVCPSSMHNMESSQTVVITSLVPSKMQRKRSGNSSYSNKKEGRQNSGGRGGGQNTDTDNEQGEREGEEGGRERDGENSQNRDKSEDKSDKRN